MIAVLTFKDEENKVTYLITLEDATWKAIGEAITFYTMQGVPLTSQEVLTEVK